ncbi:MAG: hypothetical protein ACE5EQ_03595 [Phycisphaerae bacterium]
MSTSHSSQPDRASSIANLPHDELLRYGRALGLELDDSLPSDQLAAQVRDRRDLLARLDREALLDVIKWSRRPVRQDASKEELAREIAHIRKTNYDSLSRRGLETLALLRDIDTGDTEGAEDLIGKLRSADGFWKRWHRKRRTLVGAWLSKMIDGPDKEGDGAYQFLPEESNEEENGQKISLQKEIENHGVVGGIASRLRGAADDYVKVKLDEIEQRIDGKLNEIDQRLAEWRDREVANRLKIIRITLAFTVLVAIMSLGYNYLKRGIDTEGDRGEEQTTTRMTG